MKLNFINSIHPVLTMALLLGIQVASSNTFAVEKGYSIPVVDISQDADRQVIVDKEKGQYLGHPTTTLLEDNKTMICVYPKGHGRGSIVMKRSADAGKTWSERPNKKSGRAAT